VISFAFLQCFPQCLQALRVQLLFWKWDQSEVVRYSFSELR
jgi:hypothetical protein